MKIAIGCDHGGYLLKQDILIWLEEHNIPFIAYSYTVNDEPREDDCREETRAAVYAGMRREISCTRP